MVFQIKKKNSLFNLINLNKGIKNYFFDISNKQKLKKLILKNKPDFIFHLAAQALVKNSFLFPTETWTTNTLGTINILGTHLDILIQSVQLF